MREWREEDQHRFHRIFEEVKGSYLPETGNNLSFPRELCFGPDMSKVHAIEFMLPSPLPETQEDMGHARDVLFTLPLKELVLHYTGPETSPMTEGSAIDAFSAMFGTSHGSKN